GARQRPWFLPVAVLIMVGAAVVESMVVQRVLDAHPDVGPLFALAAGLLWSIGVLGHSPGMYRNSKTGRYALFWSPRTTRARATYAALATILASIGVVLDRVAR